MVNEVIDRHNQEQGTDWKKISCSSIRQYAKQPENRNEFVLYRYGAKAYNNKVKPYSPRLTALHAGDLYQMDGTPIQIFCLDKEGKKPIRLNLFIIRDDYSGKITGFDIAETEDRYNILNTIKMAFKLHGHVPAEIVYDNASGTKTVEFNQVKNELEKLGVIMRPAKVGNPQDKGETERFFETFQSSFQRLIEGFIGEGIMSKRENGRIDIDFLNKFKQRGYFETMKIIAELIAIYNNSKNNAGIVPNQAYSQSEKPNVRTLRPERIALMFHYSKEIKVARSMIVTEIRGQKYHYQIFENKHKVKLNGTTVRMYYDETDLSNIFVFTLQGEYVCECRQYVQFHQAQVNQTEADKMQIIKQSANHNSLKPYIEQRNVELREAGEAFAGHEIQLINIFDYKKQNINDTESQACINLFLNGKGINKVEQQPETKNHNQFIERDNSDVKKLNENLYTVKKPSLKPIGAIPTNE